MISAGFKAGVSGIYTISTSEITGLENVMLEDLVTGVFTDLLVSDYTFSYDTGDPEERFLIHFTMVSLPENVSDLVNIYAAGKEVHVMLPEKTEAKIAVYNTMGQQILTSEISGSEYHENIDNPGIYLINVNIGNKVISKKIFIK